MGTIISALGTVLGYIMYFCYSILKNYWLSIAIFTVITRIILLPVSVWVHKNSIKMVKLQPEINFIKARYAGDGEIISEKQLELYKREKYSPMAGILPLFIQLGLLMGVVDVIYKPLKHLLHLNSDIITAFVNKTVELTGINPETGSIQLAVIEALNHLDFVPKFAEIQNQFSDIDISAIIESIQSINMNFLGFNLANVPVTTGGIYYLVPVVAGLTALLLCVVQNKIQVLQSEQGKVSQIGTTALSVGLSLYLGAFVPAGVGFYWMCGNIVAVLQILLLNAFISPKKYIDYEALEESKKALAESKAEEKSSKGNPYKIREKADYKKFFKDDEKQLVFYSEKSGFYKYFENIIDYILKNSDIVIHYVTSDPEDAIFQKNEPRIIPYYIGDKRLIPFMMKMDADMVVMTMPDLETYHIKRSYVRKDVEYVYIMHGLLSTHMVLRKGALDHYDTILCVGQHTIDEIRETEKIYNLPPKRLIPCGYSLIENLRRAYEQMPKKENSKKQILVAPSWQKDNIIESCIDDILSQILDKSFKIIIRPHPEFIKRYPAKINDFIEKYKSKVNDDFIIETDFSSNSTVFESDILISDWSNIAYEFAYATRKPVLFINTPKKVMNPEYTKLKNQPLDITLRNQVGISLNLDQLDKVYYSCEELLNSSEKYAGVIDGIVEKYVFNFGKSAEVGGKYIIDRLKEKEKEDEE